MTKRSYDTRYRRRRLGSPTAASPAGLNSGDILREIFLRLPPLPSSLPRVSLVCKRWRRLAADPDFLLRFRAHHRKAPLLGLFKEHRGWVSFHHVLKPPDRVPRKRFTMRIDYGGTETYPFHGTLLGCRHGRVLVLDPLQREVLVCDPITGEQRRIALPPAFKGPNICTSMAKGAVLCADGNSGHVHGGCHSSPFKVVLVHIFDEGLKGRAWACVYSSETGAWSTLISAAKQCTGSVHYLRPSILVGGSLYWWLRGHFYLEILKFDLGRQSLSLIDRPPVSDFDIRCSQIIQGEDSAFGVATLSYPSLQLWDWKVDSGVGVPTWILRKTVHLELMPNILSAETEIVGYVEDDNAILIKFNHSHNVFIVQLESMQSRKLCGSTVTRQYHPFTSFYSSGEFGRCKGLDSDPSTTPAI